MSKSKKKPQYDAQRALVVKTVAKEFSVTESYVRFCLAGNGRSINSDEIVKRYGALSSKISKALS